jgi:hypothetical protein
MIGLGAAIETRVVQNGFKDDMFGIVLINGGDVVPRSHGDDKGGIAMQFRLEGGVNCCIQIDQADGDDPPGLESELDRVGSSATIGGKLPRQTIAHVHYKHKDAAGAIRRIG